MWIERNKNKGQATSFPKEYKQKLTRYKSFLSNRYKDIDPMKLQPLISDLTNWAKTLHGLIRINEKFTKFGSEIQLQIEIQRTFDLSSALKGSNDEIKMATDSQRVENGELVLVVTIFKYGSTTLNNAN